MFQAKWNVQNSIRFLFLFSKYKALNKQNFLEHFSNEDLKTLHSEV